MQAVGCPVPVVFCSRWGSGCPGGPVLPTQAISASKRSVVTPLHFLHAFIHMYTRSFSPLHACRLFVHLYAHLFSPLQFLHAFIHLYTHSFSPLLYLHAFIQLYTHTHSALCMLVVHGYSVLVVYILPRCLWLEHVPY